MGDHADDLEFQQISAEYNINKKMAIADAIYKNQMEANKMVVRKTNGTAITPAGTLVPAEIVEKVPVNAKRMSLDSIKEVTDSGAEKIVLYGPEGWGKSTWASNAERPVFLSTEDGLKGVVDKQGNSPKSFPEPKSWDEIFEAVESLRSGTHDFKSLIVDTLDWTEMICHKFELDLNKVNSIEKIGGGFGKGYVMAFEEWKKLLTPINALRNEKGMNVIFLAHSAVRTFSNPEGENYDRYELKVDKRINALIKEWADAVLFGNYDVAVDKKKGYGGARKLYATHTAAYDAKNRYGITVPLSDDPQEFWKYTKKIGE